jgi:hypothetical protein
VLHRLLEEAALGPEAGVGEEHVEAPEPLQRGRDQRLLVVPAGHVATHCERALGSAQLFRERRQLVLRARRQHDPVVELHRAAGGRGADAAAGSGDDEDWGIGHRGVV